MWQRVADFWPRLYGRVVGTRVVAADELERGCLCGEACNLWRMARTGCPRLCLAVTLICSGAQRSSSSLPLRLQREQMQIQPGHSRCGVWDTEAGRV